MYIPRGNLYHSIKESFLFLFWSLFKTLNEKNVIKDFENVLKNYMQRSYCLTFPFMRTALYFYLKNSGFKKGDKIILSPITIKGILDVVNVIGLEPIFVDLDPDNCFFDYKELKENLNKHKDIKCILFTYLFGLVPDVDKYLKLVNSKGIKIIEDFSQCLNGKYKNKKIGQFGEVSIYSASSIKTLDTLGGGFLFTDDKKIYSLLLHEQIKLKSFSRIFLIKKSLLNLLRNIFSKNPFFSFFTIFIIKSIEFFKKGSSLKMTGSRSTKILKNLPDIWFTSYTSIQASIGLKKISNVEKTDKIRIKNSETLIFNTKLKKNNFPNIKKNSRNVYWQLIYHSKNSYDAKLYFMRNKIDISTTSLSYLPNIYSKFNNQFNIAYKIYKDSIFIPNHSNLLQNELDRLQSALEKFE